MAISRFNTLIGTINTVCLVNKLPSLSRTGLPKKKELSIQGWKWGVTSPFDFRARHLCCPPLPRGWVKCRGQLLHPLGCDNLTIKWLKVLFSEYLSNSIWSSIMQRCSTEVQHENWLPYKENENGDHMRPFSNLEIRKSHRRDERSKFQNNYHDNSIQIESSSRMNCL